MRLIWKYLSTFKWYALSMVTIKFIGTCTELLIPYIMEHILDNVVQEGSITRVILWGVLMTAVALLTRYLNVTANHGSAKVSKDIAFAVRRDLFDRTITLSGEQTDSFGLPSLTTRMTSDSYNIQTFVRTLLSMGIRAPIQLIGGIIITMSMDRGLSTILCVLAPIMIVIVVSVSRRGIPLYEHAQQGMDSVVRVLRENITGIRVVKALSKEAHEVKRFADVNEEQTHRERRAGIIMSLPGPLLSFGLNTGLAAVVLVGAYRVNAGVTKPGVILAFLTYFTMILGGVMGLNRIFMQMSKANASANRIEAVISCEQQLFPENAETTNEAVQDYLVFDHVSFRYGRSGGAGTAAGFAGESRRNSLDDVSFTLKKGGTLGIIGPTGCGKTTIIRLLMRFYDVCEGNIYIAGRNVRSYPLEELRKKFGVVLQNDTVFADTIENNIAFGRTVDRSALTAAAEDACALEFISNYEDGFAHMSAIHGANFSGGQRQRLLIARALADDPEILVLDDASSALDYRTDAALRQTIREHHGNSTTIIIAQRVSSILSSDLILVIDEGRVIGSGTHKQLLDTCSAYREIYLTQMGEES